MIEESLAELVEAGVRGAIAANGWSADEWTVEIERPRKKGFGDFTTNVALALASRVGAAPRDVAQAIADRMPTTGFVEKVEVAGPGFLNIFVTDTWLHDALRTITREGPHFGAAPTPVGRVQVEFVSANPTGPLTIGHARNAAIGDALARVFTFAGWQVEREYYFNDTGGQMDRFGASVEARYLQEVGREAEVPEDGYHGDYIADIARDILASEGPGLAELPEDERFARLLAEGATRSLEGIRRTLDRFGVVFDTYFSERELEVKGEIAAAVQRLREGGYAYDEDGAVWFRSTDFGDDKDRVMIRSNGRHTYFGADCAYLIDKFSRGFDHLVYVWGADHHGDMPRVLGAAEALGYERSAVELMIYQFVAFLRGGEPVKMSKRAGTFVSLDELIDEVGTDAARFHLLTFSPDHAMNFDIEEIKQQSLDNPVYYVQYAHARVASILRKAADAGVTLQEDPSEEVLARLEADAETDLLRELADLPEQVRVAADLRAPHRLTHYVRGVADRFHRFYTECRVVTEDAELTQARLQLAAATKQVIANTMGLLGASVPESMERIGDDER